MTADPRGALANLMSAFERHLEASSSKRGEDDPTVIAAYDDLADAFAEYDDALLQAYGEMTPLDIYDGEGDEDDEDEDDERAVVDVSAAETEEAADAEPVALHDVHDVHEVAAPEINPEWFMPPVLERLAAPVEHDDDVLPANGAPVQPVTSFPLRMPPTVDRSGIRRLRELLRSNARRRVE
jgi:hypothetical protein